MKTKLLEYVQPDLHVWSPWDHVHRDPATTRCTKVRAWTDMCAHTAERRTTSTKCHWVQVTLSRCVTVIWCTGGQP